MKIPNFIEFHNKTNIDLSNSLTKADPEEGCAILLGNKKISEIEINKSSWVVKHIWHCRNVWGEKESNLKSQIKTKLDLRKERTQSKKNHFELDPKDHIAAQKWARKNDLEILCCAHSHPKSQNIPSKIDLLWHRSPGLMVIANRDGDLKAWWIKNKFSFHKVKIVVFSLR